MASLPDPAAIARLANEFFAALPVGASGPARATTGDVSAVSPDVLTLPHVSNPAAQTPGIQYPQHDGRYTCFEVTGAVGNYSSEFTDCVKLFAAVRRVSKRFPQLKVIVVARATGLMVQRLYPNPADEAEAISGCTRRNSYRGRGTKATRTGAPAAARSAMDSTGDDLRSSRWGLRRCRCTAGR